MQRSFLSHSPEATEALGVLLGRELPPGTVMTLDGDLGTGKTTLVRGLGNGLGIEGPITSPTYTLMQAYENGRLPLYHFDAWMEGREKALLADGADEFLGAGGLAVIEWGSRVAEWLPEPRLEVHLGHRTPESRTIEIRLVGPSSAPELAQILASIGPERAIEGLEGVAQKDSDPREPSQGAPVS
ncbi:MAG: tRNA (adenosine(37)-N6)-threonylcarbamoyltransferase complex ATPase subunit type 1 TsaE [Planctomycetota bacterium]